MIGQPDLTGYALAHYDLETRLATGGMGSIYVAFHRLLQKKFAVKFMLEQFANQPEAVQRFHQETLALGKLNHPNIVSAVDAGEIEQVPYLVTELIDGTNLQDLITRNGPVSLATSIDYIRQAAYGLQHAHQLGFIHRDIKPSNLLLDQHGSIKLLDFGLVRTDEARANATQAGQLLGTLDYIAPEQAIDASKIDHRSDIYSLGCTWIFLLTGTAPFDGERYSSIVSKMKGHLLDQASCLSLPLFLPK